jgi:hypothetical protein
MRILLGILLHRGPRRDHRKRSAGILVGAVDPKASWADIHMHETTPSIHGNHASCQNAAEQEEQAQAYLLSPKDAQDDDGDDHEERSRNRVSYRFSEQETADHLVSSGAGKMDEA